MKISKDAISVGRRLFRLCLEDGKINEASFRKVIKALTEKKPRNYKGILLTLRNLLRAELKKSHIIIESAEKLDEETKTSVEKDMKAKHGNELTFEYKVNSALLGGIRIQKGDDVWDGSLKSRLDRLENAF